MATSGSPLLRFWRGRLSVAPARCCLPLLLLLLAACAPSLAPGGGLQVEPRFAEGRLATTDGLELPLRQWLPDDDGENDAARALVLALHGFNDHSAAFEKPGRWLAARGVAVYAYDQRGFGGAPHRGLWAGPERMTADLAEAVALLREAHPQTPIFLLGESMGGAVILSALAREALPPVEGAILSAPAVWSRADMAFYQRWALGLSVRMVPGLRVTGGSLDILASDNIPMLRDLGADPLVIKETRIDAIWGLTLLMDEAQSAREHLGRGELPSLLLYGQRDEVIPPEPTQAFWAVATGDETVRPALYEDGWHLLLRDLQAETVYADILRWIEAPDAPLPSGADARAAAALSAGEIERLSRPPRETLFAAPTAEQDGA